MNFSLKTVALAATAVFTMTACNNSVNIDDTNNNLMNGTWHVTYFVDSGNDETGNFTGYDFVFTAGGDLTVSNDIGTIIANWSTQDNSTPKLILSGFPEGGQWDDLNEDWHITSSSANKIVMEHVSGGNGGTDYLTLEKH